jgi:hypothetical protein
MADSFSFFKKEWGCFGNKLKQETLSHRQVLTKLSRHDLSTKQLYMDQEDWMQPKKQVRLVSS